MKKVVTLIAAMAILFHGKAQHALFSPYIEKTVAGSQYGSQLLFELKSKWSFGGFYQESMKRSEGDNSLYPFYGATINAPVMKTQRIKFFFNVRAGFVNNYFFAVAPGFETKLSFSNRLSVSLLSSIRMQSPSTALRINIKI